MEWFCLVLSCLLDEWRQCGISFQEEEENFWKRDLVRSENMFDDVFRFHNQYIINEIKERFWCMSPIGDDLFWRVCGVGFGGSTIDWRRCPTSSIKIWYMIIHVCNVIFAYTVKMKRQTQGTNMPPVPTPHPGPTGSVLRNEVRMKAFYVGVSESEPEFISPKEISKSYTGEDIVDGVETLFITFGNHHLSADCLSTTGELKIPADSVSDTTLHFFSLVSLPPDY